MSAEKEHERIDPRRLARVASTPRDLGLTGCWQVIALKRLRQPAHDPRAQSTPEVACYVTSYAVDELRAEALAAIMRAHWSAVENGVHHRRDVTFAEDVHQVKQVPEPKAAALRRRWPAEPGSTTGPGQALDHHRP